MSHFEHVVDVIRHRGRGPVDAVKMRRIQQVALQLLVEVRTLVPAPVVRSRPQSAAAVGAEDRPRRQGRRQVRAEADVLERVGAERGDELD